MRDMAILSLVGKFMRNMIGVSGRMFTTLGQGNVNIEMISQGANEINISCVIDGRDAVKALNLIHQSCLQIKPEGERGRGTHPRIHACASRTCVLTSFSVCAVRSSQWGPGCSDADTTIERAEDTWTHAWLGISQCRTFFPSRYILTCARPRVHSGVYSRFE